MDLANAYVLSGVWGWGSANYHLQASHLFLQIQIYCNTTILIHLHVVCGCFWAKTELTSCDRDYIAYKAKNMYYLAL